MNIVKMYNPKTNILIETTREFVNRWILLGFIDLSSMVVTGCTLG